MREEIRVNKFLSEAGYCSRREADRLIEREAVTIDGRTARMGDRVSEGQRVCVEGRQVSREEEQILLALHKPVGIVCTTAGKEKNNIVDFLDYPKRVYPVGRLDKDSEGLILMTNQGDIVNKMMRAGNRHEKEYEVTVDRELTKEFLQGMSRGVPLEELQVVTRPCRVERMGRNSFRIILTQGYNRQIRRMCAYFGFRVVKLKRIRIMNILLGDLPAGAWREVSEREKRELYRMLEGSSSETVRDRNAADRNTTVRDRKDTALERNATVRDRKETVQNRDERIRKKGRQVIENERSGKRCR